MLDRVCFLFLYNGVVMSATYYVNAINSPFTPLLSVSLLCQQLLLAAAGKLRFCGQPIFVAAEYLHDAFERLPVFRPRLSALASSRLSRLWR